MRPMRAVNKECLSVDAEHFRSGMPQKHTSPANPDNSLNTAQKAYHIKINSPWVKRIF